MSPGAAVDTDGNVKTGHTWDGIEMLARRLLGWPDGVLKSVARLSVAHDGIDAIKVRMAEVAPPLITRGPRKGRPHWSKACATTRIYPIERLDQEAQAWSAETGRCYPCLGSGQELAGWVAGSAPTMRACRACAGTGGQPKEVQQ